MQYIKLVFVCAQQIAQRIEERGGGSWKKKAR